MYQLKKLFTLTLLLTLIFTFFAFSQTDDMAPSNMPPGNIAPENAPMFVMFGFDDNRWADGMNWITNYMKDKVNPAGNGNPATFDGVPARATFFMASGAITPEQLVGGDLQSVDDVINSWKKAYTEGHEIANHTHDHASGGPQQPQSWWEAQATSCNQMLVEKIGVAPEDLKGFRTPFLQYGGGTMAGIKAAGLLYDTSVEWGFNDWSDQDFEYRTWPQTLNHPIQYISQSGAAPGSVAGLWEFCAYVYNTKNSTNNYNKITGFDFNMWGRDQGSYTKEQYLDWMKQSLQTRLKGGRCPLSVNLHSDYYSAHNEPNLKQDFTATTYVERQQAIEEFIDYCLTIPEVRIVPYIDVVNWMKDPVSIIPATPTPVIPPTPTPMLVNVAVNKPVVASGEFSADFPKIAVNDGSDTTVWGSKYNAGDQWFFIDLQKVTNIDNVVIKFFNPYYASTYHVGLSNDAAKWTLTNTITNGNGGDDTVQINQSARYVGLLLTKGPRLAYGVKEFEVNTYVMPVTPTPTATPIITATPTPNYPAWDPTVAYNGGDIVSHEGKYWKARYWTQGQTPGVADVWDPYNP